MAGSSLWYIKECIMHYSVLLSLSSFQPSESMELRSLLSIHLLEAISPLDIRVISWLQIRGLKTGLDLTLSGIRDRITGGDIGMRSTLMLWISWDRYDYQNSSARFWFLGTDIGFLTEEARSQRSRGCSQMDDASFTIEERVWWCNHHWGEQRCATGGESNQLGERAPPWRYSKSARRGLGHCQRGCSYVFSLEISAFPHNIFKRSSQLLVIESKNEVLSSRKQIQCSRGLSSITFLGFPIHSEYQGAILLILQYLQHISTSCLIYSLYQMCDLTSSC